MSKYLITLTPMGSFYFGGEHSFMVGKDDKNELVSYIVESNLFPQQTSLLGMLRFWILRNSDAFNPATYRISNDAEAIKLIGKQSFCADKEGNFEKIQKIGVCFLQDKDGKNILPTPLDYGLNVDFTKAQNTWYNGKKKILPEIRYNSGKSEFYTTKDGLRKIYQNEQDKKGIIYSFISEDGKPFKEDDIFKADRRIGIDRDIETGKVDNNSLYKLISYRLVEGFKFAFVAEFEKDYKLPQSGQIVELGGDSSKFLLEYKPWDKKEVAYSEDLTKTPFGVCKIVLLSNALIDNDTSDFSITETVSFRFLQFATNAATNYSRTKKDDRSNHRYSLFKRGSVFYFENEVKLKNFTDAFIAKNNFIQIGYNIIK